jgi:hypothetical protein
MKTNKRPQYMVLAGIVLLTIVVLVLVTSPSTLFSPLVTIISSDLDKSAANQEFVLTKGDFIDPEQMSSFPQDIDKWHGEDYPTESVAEQLGANALLIRGYDPETFTQPLFLTILQSRTNSSFHAPEYCYRYQGYQIQEQAKESLPVTNPAWAKDATISLPLEKLVVTKNSKDDSIIERRLVLFFYVKGNQFYSDVITLVEVQGLVPLKGTYEGTLNEARDFLSKAIPLMFKPRSETSNNQWRPLFTSLSEKGAGGYALIAIMLAVPITMIVVPLIRRKGFSR